MQQGKKIKANENVYREWRIIMYEMKDEYMTGIDFIDKEHRRLFEIAEETYRLKNDEFIPDKYDQIQNLLDELKDYTAMHFSHEEEYMQSIGYKKLFPRRCSMKPLSAGWRNTIWIILTKEWRTRTRWWEISLPI